MQITPPPGTHHLREQFLIDPQVIFLNHGSFGATPRPVFEVYQNWQLELERQPVEFLGRRSHQLLLESRKSLGEYLQTDWGNIVYVSNATTGVNIVARSLKLGPGDEILATNHEYGAMDRTWKYLSQRNGFSYKNQVINVPVKDTDQIISDLWMGVTPQTKVIFISHITSPTALIFPIEEICVRARAEGILTVVDGAHAPGQIDLNLEKIGADFYCGNLHKWLCAPKGCAFLYARPDVQRMIEPLIVSWGWQSEKPGESQFVDYLEWTGTRDIAAFLTAPEAIKFSRTLDDVGLRRYSCQLATWTHQLLHTRLNSRALCANSLDWFRQMSTLTLPGKTDVQQLQTRLYNDFRIEIPALVWEDYKLLRFSIHAYNSQADILKLQQALSVILTPE